MRAAFRVHLVLKTVHSIQVSTVTSLLVPPTVAVPRGLPVESSFYPCCKRVLSRLPPSLAASVTKSISNCHSRSALRPFSWCVPTCFLLSLSPPSLLYHVRTQTDSKSPYKFCLSCLALFALLLSHLDPRSRNSASQNRVPLKRRSIHVQRITFFPLRPWTNSRERSAASLEGTMHRTKAVRTKLARIQLAKTKSVSRAAPAGMGTSLADLVTRSTLLLGAEGRAKRTRICSTRVSTSSRRNSSARVLKTTNLLSNRPKINRSVTSSEASTSRPPAKSSSSRRNEPTCRTSLPTLEDDL